MQKLYVFLLPTIITNCHRLSLISQAIAVDFLIFGGLVIKSWYVSVLAKEITDAVTVTADIWPQEDSGDESALAHDSFLFCKMKLS